MLRVALVGAFCLLPLVDAVAQNVEKVEKVDELIDDVKGMKLVKFDGRKVYVSLRPTDIVPICFSTVTMKKAASGLIMDKFGFKPKSGKLEFKATPKCQSTE